MMVFGWVTIVFAIIDAKVGPAALADVSCGHKATLDKWDPRTLPPVPRHRHTVPVWQLVVELVVAVLVLAWWLAVPSNPFLLFGPGAAFLAPGPGLLAAFIPVAIACAIFVVLKIVELWQPHRRTVLQVISNAVQLAAIGAVLQTGGPYVVAAAGPDAPASLTQAMVWINRAVVIGMAVAAAITLSDLFKHVWRLGRPRHVAATASTRPGSPR